MNTGRIQPPIVWCIQYPNLKLSTDQESSEITINYQYNHLRQRRMFQHEHLIHWYSLRSTKGIENRDLAHDNLNISAHYQNLCSKILEYKSEDFTINTDDLVNVEVPQQDLITVNQYINFISTLNMKNDNSRSILTSIVNSFISRKYTENELEGVQSYRMILIYQYFDEVAKIIN